MSGLNVGKAPPNSTILPFYATGAMAFWILSFLLFLSAGSLTAHFFNPHLLAIVHTAALGWGTMIIFGAAHQLLPVVCERDLFSPKIATLCWYSLFIGVLLLTSTFWNFRVGGWMILGGSLIVLSVIAFCINTVMTSRIFRSISPARLFVVSAAIWLLITASIGLLLAINLSHPFFSKNHLEILKLHAHAGLGGWFLQLIAGISSKLVPMFLLAKQTKDRWMYRAWFLQNIGLILFLLDGYFLGINNGRVLIYAIFITAGILCWLYFIFDSFTGRLRRKIDMQMRHTFSSFVFLILGFLLIPVVLYSGGSQWTILYGTLLFMGWITGIILGKTFKTLPFIVWNGLYKTLTGKIKIPLPKDLYQENLLKWQYGLYLAALLTLATGIVIGSVLIIQISAVLWMMVATVYLYNVLKILLHKPQKE